MTRRLMVEWKCDAVACGLVAWTELRSVTSAPTLPGDWVSGTGVNAKVFCGKHAHLMHAHNTRRAPIQGEATNCRRGAKPHGTVTWTEHVQAWTEYHRHYHEQDAETIARRGGFGYWEITDLLGHEPTTWAPR